MATAHVIPFPPRRSSASLLDFAAYRSDAAREPVSPFRHLMPPRQLSPRQIVHRRRMLQELVSGSRPVSAAARRP